MFKNELKMRRNNEIMLPFNQVIDGELFRFESILGKGAFGIVYKCRKNNGQIVAIKKITDVLTCWMEAKIMRQLSGPGYEPFFVQCHKIFRTSSAMFLVMEYCPDGSLENFIRRKGRLEYPIGAQYFAQLIMGIEKMHQLGLMHRDLKPANILVARRADGNIRMKIADFGISKAASANAIYQTLCGTPFYMAPIHDHSSSQCFVKILKGILIESRFNWPKQNNEDNGQEEEAMVELSTKEYGIGEVTKITDKNGLHRVKNGSNVESAITLHLYIPPFDQCQVFDQQTGKRQRCNVTYFSEFGQKVDWNLPRPNSKLTTPSIWELGKIGLDELEEQQKAIILGTTQMQNAATNVQFQRHKVTRHERANALGQFPGYRGCTIWFTGLSGAGKTTIALSLENILIKLGIPTYVLDGDNIRHGLCKDLGFSIAERSENIRRASEMAKLLADGAMVVLASFISPIRKDRDEARRIHSDVGIPFYEIYVNAPIEICEARDPKKLYKKARSGEIKVFTGVDSPYEIPLKPDLILNSDVEMEKQSVEKMLKFLHQRQILPDKAMEMYFERFNYSLASSSRANA